MTRQTIALAVAGILVACAAIDAPATETAPEAPDGAIRAVPMPSAPLDEKKTLTRIVFGSCASQLEDQSIWNRIADEHPDLVFFMGDNVYGDVNRDDPAMPSLKAAYMRLAQSEPFSRVRAAAPVLTTWDDHDMGRNDGGGDYPYKEAAEALYEYVWAIPDDDPRRARPGVYGSWIIGAEEGKRVQIIMLDTRFFRSPLMKTDEWGAHGKERYLPDGDPEKTMLGAAQWAWLENELNKPVDLRLLVSSIQVLAEGHGWEAWRTLPRERERLFSLIRKTGAENVILLSGDRHAAALYRRDDALEYPLFEATSSSLNLPASVWRAESGETYGEPGPYRLGDMYYDANYGVLEIDWANRKAGISIRSADGAPVRSKVVSLDALR